MMNTLWAEVRDGKIELLEPTELSEGQKLLVTILSDDETLYWMRTSQVALDRIWDNDVDDVYAQLLEE